MDRVILFLYRNAPYEDEDREYSKTKSAPANKQEKVEEKLEEKVEEKPKEEEIDIDEI